jgi:anti-anti-sigma factor
VADPRDDPTDEERGVVHVVFPGDSDIAGHGALLEQIQVRDPVEVIVELDVSHVGFVDSRGLRAILETKAWLDRRGCELWLARPQPQLRQLIERLDLREFLTIVDR